MGVSRRVGGPNGDPRQAIRDAVSRGAFLAGEHILGVAVQNAPVDEGTLRNSGATTRDGTTCVISFDTPYAAKQHEELDYHHPRGGGAKFLEKAMVTERDTAQALITRAIRAALEQ